MALTAEHVESFRSLEEALWKSVTRGNPAWMDRLLSSTFVEHGESGWVYDRKAVLAKSTPAEIEIELPLTNFEGRVVGDGVVLLTYTSVAGGRATNRVSIWSHDGRQWILEFHQGTLAASEPEPAMPAPPTVPVIDTAALRYATFDQMHRGYDAASVDRFLNAVADRIDSGQAPTADLMAAAKFDAARRGYHPRQVDDLLAELE